MSADQFPIDNIVVTLKTADVEDAGANGDVYLQMVGREFCLARPDIVDRARGAEDRYRLGKNANIAHPLRNDPRKLILRSATAYPVGLRFEPADTEDDWKLEGATAKVTGEDGLSIRFVIPRGGNTNLWLGTRYGLRVSLKIVDD